MDDLAQGKVDADGASAWADRARRALRAYASEDCDIEQELGDLLCDLRHLADAEGIAWSALTAHAEFHYTYEV